MPLPKEYYDILESGDRPLTSPAQPSPTGIYQDLTPDITEEASSAWGGVGDFLWSAGTGFTSGMTWGLTDLAGVTGQEPWEEMTGTEKAGWILGEGASFFAPWGPFWMLGKGGKALAKTGNKFIGEAAKEASETGIAKLTGETGKAVAKAMEKGTQFSDDVVSGLNKVAKDDLGVRWIKDLGATGKAALDASDNLTMAGTRAVMKSFDDAGIEIAQRDAARIAGDFVESVKGGTYVNDVAEWVTRGLAGRIPDTASGFMSKYLGMVAQDMMFMGIHGLGSGKIKALANGEDFDATYALSHAAIMSLGFPLIRKIPNLAGMGRGGMVTASQGIKAYMNQFKGTNYKAIQEMHGDDVVKNMLKVMVRGSKKDLWSRSSLGDAHWKAGGKIYKSAEEIERALPKMKIDDTITLLNKMNKTVNQQILKKWGPEFILDTIGSVPRMGLGVLAMNPDIVKKDFWSSLEGPEIASHLFIAAVMTRGRGAWGHSQQRAYFADFTPYHEALNVLGVNTKNVQDVLRFHDGKHPYEGMGVALGTHEAGVELTSIFDANLKNAESRPNSRDFSNPDHSLVVDMANLYNVIKKSADPNFKPIKAENLDAKTLNTLAHQLSGIKFADGNTVADIGYEGALVRLTLEPAKRGLEVYKQMLSELGRLGYDVAVTEDGRVTGSHIMSNKEGKTIDDANSFNRVLDALAGINEASVKTGIDGQSQVVNYEKIVKASGLTEGEFNLRTREIIDQHMDILGREYGDKNIYRDPVKDNPMFDFFKQAKGIEAAERVYNIATGKFPVGDKNADKILTENMDSLFMLTDGKYASSIDQYKGLIKDLIKDPKTDKDKAANEVIMENLNDMRMLFEVRKLALGGTSSKDAGEKGSLSAEGLSIVQGKWNDIFRSLPIEWKQNWASHTKQLYIERIFKGRGFDRRALNLISFMAENNLVLPDAEGKINMPSKKAMMDELATRNMSKKQLDQYERALDTIKKVLGEDVVTEIDWAFTESGKRQLEAVDVNDYLKAAKMLGNEMYSDLLVNTQAVLGEIAAVSSGTRQRVHELYNKTTDIIDTLDPASNKRPVADPIKEINTLKDELIALETVARSKDSKDELGQAIVQLHEIINAIDPATGKFNITPKRTLTEAEQLSGDQFGIHDALTRPLQVTLEKIFNREYEAVNQLQELVVKLENLSSMGKAGLGLDKSDTMRIVEDLSRQWFEVYKGEAGKGVKVLSELISEVNKKGFFGDAVNLLEGVNERINREIILKNEHHPLNEDGVRMSEALEAGYKTHEHHRSVTEILKDYGLVDKDGKIDEGFKNAVTANPYRALVENVREKIYAQKDKSITQKANEWKSFREKDAIELLTNIYNSKPINRAKILGITRDGKKRGILEFNNNAPHIQHPNTQYFGDKGFKVHWLDDTMSIDIGDGKLRNASISTFSVDRIQNFLNEALRTDVITKEILDGFKSIDHGLREKDIRKILKNPSDYVFYLRLSPMDKMMFVATEKNLKLMDTEFETWYNDTSGRLKGKDKTTFESMFKHLLDEANTSRHIVELKMLLPYLDYAGKRGELEKMIAEYAGDANPQRLAKIEANMFKRGFLSDGGTTQPMRPEVLRWVKNHHPNKEVREVTEHIIRNGGFITGLIGDGAAEGSGGRAHPLNIESIELGQLQVIGNQASGLVKELAQAQQRSLADMPSLLNSLLDGGKFASERVMKLIMAQKGMLDTDFTNSPNGAKTIIFAVGNNQMLGKGYLIYHPDIAAQMPKDVDIMLGESSAKTYSGIAMDGNPLTAYDISQAGPKWQSSIKNMGNGNKMLMPIESLGISFTSKSESGVAISPSIFDFQSPAAIDKAITWMGFEAKLKQIGVQWNSVHKDGAKLSEWLYEIGQAEGNPLDKGDTGLSKLLFTYGAMPNNPLVQKALRRLLRSSNYKHLSKVPNQGGGEDNFIIPNINGDLSVPLYADLNRKGAFPGDPAAGKIDRVSVNYGGIGINSHTGGRQLGNGVNSNLEGERFIFRDGNGVDVVIGLENGKFKYYSTFYDKTGEAVEYRGTDKTGADALRDANIKMDANSKQRAQRQMEELSKLVKEYNLNYQDVFKVLNGETITKQDINGVNQSISMPVDKALKMQFGLMSHAVPVVGHDKVIFRVEKIMDNMSGLTEVNVHDLRTIMQRDNDGDHLFTHTKLPWEVFVNFAKENGRKDDFRMFDRGRVLDQNYINIFGVGNNGRAGEKPEQVGFQNYASKLHNAKMMVGQVIGARNAISWLNRLGFQMYDPTSRKGELVLKDFLANKDMSSSEWQTLDKFYDTIQNALDIHGGIHESISNQQKLRDFLFFGHAEKYAEPTGDVVFDKHNQPGLGFFRDPNFGKNRIQKEVFYEILRTLKKANMIQNETWDEKGSRAPEPFEIKNAYYDMRAFFTNPTAYIAKQLARKIGRIRNTDERSALISEYANMFYGDTIDIRKIKDRNNLYFDILKGKQGSIMKQIFSFDHRQVPPDNPIAAFDKSIGGHVMKGLIRTNGFWDANYEGLAQRSEAIFNRAGFFVKNIESFVETARMFGDNPVAVLAERSISVDSFDTRRVAPEIRSALNNGILRELIHRQHRNVMGTLEYFRAEKFTNDTKLSKLQSRLGNLQAAMDIMDQQIAKDMVIDRSDSQYLVGKRKKQIRFNNIQKGRKVAVYRVRGDVQVIDTEAAKPSLFSHGIDGKRLDYGQLEFVGTFDSKSKPLFTQEGYSYVIDRKPKQMISQSGNEARYSQALFKATYGNEITPERFIKDNVNDFRDDVRQLRASISVDYIKTVQNALSNRVLSDGLFAMQQAKEGRAIAEFMDRWEPMVSGGDPVKLLLRYLLQPQLTPSSYYKDAQGHEMPAYKTNEYLYKTVMQWAENNGQGEFVKDLVRDVEHYASGRDTQIDISGHERGSMDRFDYSALGDMANPVRSLAKHLNLFFASPVLTDKLNQVIPKGRGKIETVIGRDGQKIPIRRVPKKDEYWNIQTDQTGEGC